MQVNILYEGIDLERGRLFWAIFRVGDLSIFSSDVNFSPSDVKRGLISCDNYGCVWEFLMAVFLVV